ncbi:MAG: hypothetical protein RIA09_15850 [Hoeflea sp.]|jgi:hypothetical protein|uniref:hypothetical protein n=1 Tax=Hoeflea sp. TaxID=1940281 RepID=UPI0032EC175F
MSLHTHREEILTQKEVDDQFAYFEDWNAEPNLSRWDIVRIFLFLIILVVIFAFAGQALNQVIDAIRGAK